MKTSRLLFAILTVLASTSASAEVFLHDPAEVSDMLNGTDVKLDCDSAADFRIRTLTYGLRFTSYAGTTFSNCPGGTETKCILDFPPDVNGPASGYIQFVTNGKSGWLEYENVDWEAGTGTITRWAYSDVDAGIFTLDYDNLVDSNDTGDPGETPYCGSDDTTPPIIVFKDPPIEAAVNAFGTVTVTANTVDGGTYDLESDIMSRVVSPDTTFVCSDVGSSPLFTFTATNAAGLSSVDTVNVTVVDNNEPVTHAVAGANIDIYLDGAGNASVTQAQIDALDKLSEDNCDSLGLTFNLSQTSFDTADSAAPVNVDFWATDSSGNDDSSPAPATVTVNEAPTEVTVIDTPDPSGVGEDILVTATVTYTGGGTSGVPLGSILIENDESSDSCTATLTQESTISATGSCSLNPGTAGSRPLTATYQPDASSTQFEASSATESHEVIAIEPPTDTAPVATGTVVNGDSTSSVNVTWTDNSNNETGFVVERCSDSTCNSSTEVNTTAANATSQDDSGLACATDYWYRVKAISGTASSGYDGPAMVTTSACEPPAVPGNLQATLTTASGVTPAKHYLEWTNESGSGTSFWWIWSDDGGANWWSYASTTNTDVTHQNLMCSRAYTYKVRAYKNSLFSAYTDPTTVDATCTGNTISVTATPEVGGTASCSPNPTDPGGSSVCTATPSTGYVFSTWSGACSGPTCEFTNVTTPLSVVAEFVVDPTYEFTCTPAPGPATVIQPAHSGNEMVQSETSIVTDGVVIVPNGVSVRYMAGESIILNENFQAENGSNLQAEITPIDCTAN